MIDAGTIDKIMNTANIVDVVGEFVSLRRAGTNFKGLCPFHNEKTPSFVVSPAKQLCKCFGCGKGGNVVHFLMELEQLSYPEAIKWLGRKYGIEVQEKEMTDAERAQQSVRESLFVLNEWALQYFEEQLHHSPDGIAIGLNYFRQRGLRDDIIRKFHLGYSPEERTAMAQAAVRGGFQKDYLIKTGLCFETQYHELMDRYHGRVIYPIHTVSGKVVAFGGRILTQAKNVGKYVNSPESEIYSKAHQLYGLYQAKRSIVQKGSCFLVEGYMDVISLHQYGVENVVASSGTALTEDQVRLLHRFTENIIILFDADAAGIHAAMRSIDLLLAEGIHIKVLTLPNNEDPDSFAQQHRNGDLEESLLKYTEDFITYKVNMLLKDAADDPVKRAEALDNMITSIAVIPSGLLRQSYAHECALMLDTQEELILAEVSKKRRLQTYDKNAKQSAAAQAPSSNITIPMRKISKVEKMERLIVQEIIYFGEVAIFQEEEEVIDVVHYIQEELAVDGLQLKVPLYLRILDIALVESQRSDWKALSFFLNHPDEEINKFAAEVATSVGELCQNNKQQYGDDVTRLCERLPILINDYKLALVESKINLLKSRLQLASKEGRDDESFELMKEIKQLTEVYHLMNTESSRTFII